ncbi:MAG: PAS domain-containing protein, partial [Anaerolineae bacterium]|nr:PAS domain-containing protein [Anaerolineae bacterium]
ILFRGILRMPDQFRGQIYFIVLAVVVMSLSNMLYISGINPIAPYDPLPLSFVITGVLFMAAMYRYKFLDVVPVAYNLIFKNVKSGVIIIDHRGHVLDVNLAAEHMLNRTSEAMLGQSILGVFPEYTDLIKRFQDVPEIKTEITLEQDMRCYELQITPFLDHKGKPAGRIIMLYDLTAHKQAEAEREQLIADLEAYGRTVAHDLKNPLSVILGFASLLVEELEATSPEEVKGYLELIVSGSEKMSHITDELLLLASVRRLDEVRMEPLHMGSIVKEALARLRLMIDEHQAEIIVPEASAWPVALGYAAWIEEIWVNYISNGIKYGGTPPHIELGATVEADGIVRFWVRDNGPGLSPEEQESLFTQFARLDETRAQGHGLGLSIVKRIVEKLGGQVGVESASGQGSVFSFTLPISA